MSTDIWILGATGRTGVGIARELTERGIAPVLVGRSREKLDAAARTSDSRTVVAGTTSEMAAAIRSERPAVVINTVGPFQETAGELASAALVGGHYLDLANELGAILDHRERDASARQAGHTIVTGAGFGVTATESVLTWISDGQPVAQDARVDMIPSFASSAGRVGEALAGSLLGGIPGTPGGGRFQARRIADGKLAPAPLGGNPTSLVTPDGDVATTSLMPLGELLAAQRVRGTRHRVGLERGTLGGGGGCRARPAAVAAPRPAPPARDSPGGASQDTRQPCPAGPLVGPRTPDVGGRQDSRRVATTGRRE